MTTWVRPSAVAGRFYPGEPATLRRTVEELLRQVDPAIKTALSRSPKAVIVPHAGYQYSGSIAASAFATLAPARDFVRRVIVAGPAHAWPISGVAVSSAEAFDTPLGPVSIDDDARCRALEVPGVIVDNRAHAEEHSLEVQLPFLAAVFGNIPIVPLVVGRSGAHVLERVLDALWAGTDTRIVISTDLSHYRTADVARTLDTRTAEAICRLDVPSPDMACGAFAVAGLMLVARRRNLHIDLLDLRNSADTSGNPEQVVGYGAFAMTEST